MLERLGHSHRLLVFGRMFFLDSVRVLLSLSRDQEMKRFQISLYIHETPLEWLIDISLIVCFRILKHFHI